MDPVLYVGGILGVIIGYALVRYDAARTASGAQARAWIRPGSERFLRAFVLVFIVGYVILAAVDYASGGVISHADRFWVGLLAGLGLGAFAVTVVVRARTR